MRLFPNVASIILLSIFWVGYSVFEDTNRNNKRNLSSLTGFKTHVEKADLDIKRNNSPEYYVSRTEDIMIIDANWEKPQWRDVLPVEVNNYMGLKPKFSPGTEVKMMYNDENIFIIFRVHDKFIQSRIQKIHGPVYEDSCVEFFFSPNEDHPEEYFDFEINCGGTPLICYVPGITFFTKNDIEQLSIAHSMPEVVFPEIRKAITWTIECKIPFSVLEKFSDIVRPKQGVCWRANFFKTASKGSNPHYLTWSFIESEIPNFHLPQYFGRLKFI